MSNYLLGIDYGTGGAKAAIIDKEANILAYAFREYPIVTQKPGWSEHDPVLYWKIACEIIKECIKKASIDPKDIKGIGTSSALPCMVMIDRNGNPINMAYNLMDRRAVKEVEWLKNNIGENKIFEITGNRLDDHPSLVNLMWERNNRPQSFKKIYKALTIDGFIRYKLTGKYTANYPTAAFYGVAYDIRRKEFNKEILDKIGIDMDLLPEVFGCEDIIGHVTERGSEEAGLVKGIAVCAGGADACSGWIGGGAIEVGDTHINLGTCGVLGVIHKDTDFLNTMVACAYNINSANTYVTIGVTTTGGFLIRYLRDNFSEIEVAAERLMNGINAYDIIEMQAKRIAPGSNGLLVLPYLMGERTPIWDVQARAVVFGLSLNHTKGHLARAMMESVAYALYDSFTLIANSGRKINYPIVMNEGGAKSKLWRRIITDVFNIPTVFVKNRAGAPYGDAILAGVATKIFKDFTIAREKAEYIDLMEPIEKNHNHYMKYFRIYKNLYEHVKQDFKELAELRNKFMK
jgi:ribulokinase